MTDIAEDTRTYVRELLAVDRCDRCTAGAMVAVQLLNGELLFCGHHGREFVNAISEQAINVYDPNGVLSWNNTKGLR